MERTFISHVCRRNRYNLQYCMTNRVNSNFNELEDMTKNFGVFLVYSVDVALDQTV